MIEFRLLYSGPLKGASRKNTRADLKHAIRKTFHPQLMRLWQTNRQLRDYALAVFRERDDLSTFPSAPGEEAMVAAGLEWSGKRWRNNDYSFVPIVMKHLGMEASIDIVLLRPEEPRILIESGDLDNRLKTIFDALRMPTTLEEVAGQAPAADEKRFFCCLLEDDKLISEIHVTTDQLLLLPHHQNLGANDVFLMIHVKVFQKNASVWVWKFD